MPIETKTLLASAARIATTATSEYGNTEHRGMLLIVDVTARAGATTLTPSLQILDPVGGAWVTIWTIAAAIDSDDTTLGYLFYPSPNTDAASLYTEEVDLVLGCHWRVNVVASDTDSVTYSLAAYMLP